jgi:LuxR family maltose regulon positive regulatory protein
MATQPPVGAQEMLLLRTKLYTPPARPDAQRVPRPRLIERLNAGTRSDHKLTLISAPAGFGKTTLVSEWVHSLRLDTAGESQIASRVAWLSLDGSDNDPTRFLIYIVATLQAAVQA